MSTRVTRSASRLAQRDISIDETLNSVSSSQNHEATRSSKKSSIQSSRTIEHSLPLPKDVIRNEVILPSFSPQSLKTPYNNKSSGANSSLNSSLGSISQSALSFSSAMMMTPNRARNQLNTHLNPAPTPCTVSTYSTTTKFKPKGQAIDVSKATITTKSSLVDASVYGVDTCYSADHGSDDHVCKHTQTTPIKPPPNSFKEANPWITQMSRNIESSMETNAYDVIHDVFPFIFTGPGYRYFLSKFVSNEHLAKYDFAKHRFKRRSPCMSWVKFLVIAIVLILVGIFAHQLYDEYNGVGLSNGGVLSSKDVNNIIKRVIYDIDPKIANNMQNMHSKLESKISSTNHDLLSKINDETKNNEKTVSDLISALSLSTQQKHQVIEDGMKKNLENLKSSLSSKINEVLVDANTYSDGSVMKVKKITDEAIRTAVSGVESKLEKIITEGKKATDEKLKVYAVKITEALSSDNAKVKKLLVDGDKKVFDRISLDISKKIGENVDTVKKMISDGDVEVKEYILGQVEELIKIELARAISSRDGLLDEITTQVKQELLNEDTLDTLLLSLKRDLKAEIKKEMVSDSQSVAGELGQAQYKLVQTQVEVEARKIAVEVAQNVVSKARVELLELVDERDKSRNSKEQAYVEELNGKIAVLQDQLQKYEDNLQNKYTKVSEASQEETVHKNTYDELNARLTSLNSKIQDNNSDIDKKMKLFENNIKKTILDKMNQVASDLDNLLVRADLTDKRVSGVEDRIQGLEATVDELGHIKLQSQEIMDNMAQLQLDINTITNTNTTLLENEILRLSKDIDRLKYHQSQQSPQHLHKLDIPSIQALIDSSLEFFDADRTRKVDYALRAHGASIHDKSQTFTNDKGKSNWLSTFTTCKQKVHPPEIILEPSHDAGSCWPMESSSGYVTISLSQPITIEAITIQHIHPDIATNPDTAPKSFSLYGLTAQQAGVKDGGNSPLVGELLGTFEYIFAENTKSLDHIDNSTEGGSQPNQNTLSNHKTVQTFNTLVAKRPYQYVKVVINSNYGNPDYTCLYRIRIHGTPFL